MKKYINLFLDDIRDCPEEFVVARNIDDAIEIIKNNNIRILSLDHDLGIDENNNLLPTGYDLVKWICENGIDIDEIYMHTDNCVGRENMYQTLLGAQRRGFISEFTKIYYWPHNH